VDKETNIITKFLHQGVYDEVQVNSFKFFILRFLMNKHPINDRLYKFKVTVFERKYTIFVFALAFFLSYVFYIFNNAEGNYLISFIANNIWAQTVIFFITISGFINIFHPFTIKKELSEKEIKRISAEIYKKNEEKKEFLEKRKNRYRL
jgi:magnesium-transporting ATPase (P-type)